MADWSENEAKFSLRQAHEDKEVPPYVFDSEVPTEKSTVSVHDSHHHLLKMFLKKLLLNFRQPLVSFSELSLNKQHGIKLMMQTVKA